MKYYHLLSDDKTVKGISWEKYRKLCQRDGFKVVALEKAWLNMRKGTNYVYINLRQLRQILREKEVS